MNVTKHVRVKTLALNIVQTHALIHVEKIVKVAVMAVVKVIVKKHVLELVLELVKMVVPMHVLTPVHFHV